MDTQDILRRLRTTSRTIGAMIVWMKQAQDDIEEMVKICEVEYQKSWVLSEDQLQEAADLGRTVEVIKHFKAKFNCSLRDAKDAAEEYMLMRGR